MRCRLVSGRSFGSLVALALVCLFSAKGQDSSVQRIIRVDKSPQGRSLEFAVISHDGVGLKSPAKCASSFSTGLIIGLIYLIGDEH
jgi:hypothetical protein